MTGYLHEVNTPTLVLWGDQDKTLAPSSFAPLVHALPKARGEMLQNALARLSPDLREAVIMRDLQEMEYREIAGVLKVPEGTVKSRIFRGRSELAERLGTPAKPTESNL